jgi:hypothetical protein
VSGTVKTIPSNSVGALDTNSPAELRFHYGSSVYALPYQKISNAEIVEPAGHHLWKVPVPKLGKGARLLSITIREGDETGMLTFRTSASEANRIAADINEHGKRKNAVKTSDVKPDAPMTSAAKRGNKPDKKQAAHAKSAKAKTSDVEASTGKPAAAQEAWWGDRYWKTTRNKDKWPSGQPADASGMPAGTK